MNPPSLPPGLPPLPKGYVYLGEGGTFEIPPKGIPFRGLGFNPNYVANWIDDFWYGVEDSHYAAPADSEIVRLNFPPADPVNTQLLAALESLLALIDEESNTDDGCLYIFNRTASSWEGPIQSAREAIANAEKP